MSKSKSPTFILELPLQVNAEQTATLLARLEVARQVYNACLGEALQRREHLLHSTAYQRARTMPTGQARVQAFAEAQEKLGLGNTPCMSTRRSSGMSGWEPT